MSEEEIKEKEKQLEEEKKKVEEKKNNSSQENLATIAMAIQKILEERGAIHIDELSGLIKVNKQRIFRALHELVKYGYKFANNDGLISLSKETLVPLPGTSEHPWRSKLKILAWSGTELGSIGQQGDLLYTLYHTIAPTEKVDFIIGLGNIIQGYLPRGKERETFFSEYPFVEVPDTTKFSTLTKKGAKRTGSRKTKFYEKLYINQTRYVAEIFPWYNQYNEKRQGRLVKTYLISGIREMSFVKQGLINPLIQICQHRRKLFPGLKSDLVYYGDYMHMFRVINAGPPIGVLAVTSKRTPFRGVYTRGYRPRKTSGAIAGSLITRLKRMAMEEYPRVILWTDGEGMYTVRGDAEATTFVSLPKLAVKDPTDLELDTPPNIGCVILELDFDEKGNLLKNGIKVGYRDLSPYVKDKGW